MGRVDAALLVGFLNTAELQGGVDVLDTSTVEEWRVDGQADDGRAAHVGPAGSTAPDGTSEVGTSEVGTSAVGTSAVGTPADALRAVREGIRAVTRAPGMRTSAQQHAIDRADAALRQSPLIVGLDPAAHVLAPFAADDEAAVRMAIVAAAFATCRADGWLDRLRTCADDSCQWAFLDASRNRSRRWCDMGECGNRDKNRSYRARRVAGRRAPRSAGDRP